MYRSSPPGKEESSHLRRAQAHHNGIRAHCATRALRALSASALRKHATALRFLLHAGGRCEMTKAWRQYCGYAPTAKATVYDGAWRRRSRSK
jgi:hypothetical protein